MRSLNPPALPTPKGFSHVTISAGGPIVFVSGQVAYDGKGQIVGAGDYAAQTRQVMQNLQTALEAANSDLSHILKLTFFVKDISEPAIAAIREARKEFLNDSRLPASTMVGVAGLAKDALLLEVEAYAAQRGA